MRGVLRAATAALTLAGCVATAALADEPAVARDQHGRAQVWRGPSGSVTLLEFAASWCAPCRKTLPRLEAFARAHPGLRVLTVSVDERRQGRDELVASLGLTIPMVWDEEHRIAGHYRPRAMPAAFLLSPAGEVLHTALGSRADDWEELARRTEEELARAPALGAAESQGPAPAPQAAASASAAAAARRRQARPVIPRSSRS